MRISMSATLMCRSYLVIVTFVKVTSKYREIALSKRDNVLLLVTRVIPRKFVILFDQGLFNDKSCLRQLKTELSKQKMLPT